MRLRIVSIVSLALILTCGQPGKSQTVRQTKPRAMPQTKTQAPLVVSSYPSLALQGKELGDAYRQKNFERFAELTYAKLVTLAGGKAPFIKAIAKEADKQEASGLKLLSYTLEAPTQFLRDSGNLYAVIPVTLTAEMPDGVFNSFSCMIGVSGDDGRSWTFIDVGNKGKEGLRYFFGAAVDKFELPPEKMPLQISG
jgi:hypothetical protein